MRRSGLIMFLPGVLFLLSCAGSSGPSGQLVSLGPVFPLELGDVAPRALAKLQCPSGRRLTWTDNRVESVECDNFPLGLAPEERGTIRVRFEKDRAVEIRWERRLSEAPVDRVLRLHQELVRTFRSPQLSNTEGEETWPSALERGEWHHRWGLGNGLFFSWFARVDPYALGNTREPSEPQYAWVLMAKHRPFE